MGFIERLRQEETAKSLSEQQLKAQQDTREKERFEREVAERERHAQRKQQAENFRQESGVSSVVAELGEFLKESGRGHSSIGLGKIVHFTPKDPDSVFNCVEWDNQKRVHPRQGWLSGFDTVFYSEKFIVVETCPDGRIIFHAGKSTTAQIEEWRNNDKKDVFEKALEKAYKTPFANKYVMSQGSIKPVYYVE